MKPHWDMYTEALSLHEKLCAVNSACVVWCSRLCETLYLVCCAHGLGNSPELLCTAGVVTVEIAKQRERVWPVLRDMRISEQCLCHVVLHSACSIRCLFEND